ncbi:MAG: hypothetical protein AMXMBFR64_42020 [Myxococcales bacterium]
MALSMLRAAVVFFMARKHGRDGARAEGQNATRGRVEAKVRRQPSLDRRPVDGEPSCGA